MRVSSMGESSTELAVGSLDLSQLADLVLDKLPLDDPLFAQLSQYYYRLQNLTNTSLLIQPLKEAFSQRGIPLHEVHTVEEFKVFLNTLLQKVAAKKIRNFLLG